MIGRLLRDRARTTPARVAIDYDGRKVMGLNNIELITDRPLDVNLEEITRVIGQATAPH